ncbi:homeobox protein LUMINIDEPENDENS [Senna tora]|uniref:Homeobox protein LUMINIDEPENDENS n=1 Tax=Senna tora TaxID=362788 RepID=A0A834TAH2_9FABA|nr:homeobox protein LUMINIDEPENDENS [Senna tora]
MMEGLNDDFSQLEIGSSMESFQKSLVSQRDLFHSQIDQFQKIVVTQCKLDGVNPLSQEMAADALSIKIGKRPRDLLNPKAVNYMQSIFSIKDAISKKESRELSALFGITVTQIREFFTSQRSRIRRLVQLSRERVIRSNFCEEAHDGSPINSDSMRPMDPAPLNSAGATRVQDASCSTPDNALSVLNDLDRHFVDNIFILMQKEETFSGQEKLMECILKIQNSSVLCWFLSSGGVMVLATWLSEAAVEEQTSVLLLILKVLCHLPLQHALPKDMSAILQCVNKLRFYRTADISNRARDLLSKWSKLLASNQAIKKSSSVKPSIDPQQEMVLPQRKVESPPVMKLLPASVDDSTKKPVLGVSSSQARKRRKVVLVEQPEHKTVSRSPHAAKSGPVSQGRPLSADDIQKAKKRAFYMQSKYGKPQSKESKTDDGLHKQTDKVGVVASPSQVPLSPKIKEDKKCQLVPFPSNRQEDSIDSKLRVDLKGPLSLSLSLREKRKRVQVPWKTPAELKLNEAWRVGGGENSKEVDVQNNRNQREKQTIYHTLQEIPCNPKEPWDHEMNYDDMLTPQIPIEQQLDRKGAETPVAPNQSGNLKGGPTSSSYSNVEPDLELLAVLLKNPDLVFALTSGQAGSLPSEETVKLLDMIKKSGSNMPENINVTQGKVQVSLPSPTPSSEPRTSAWRTEAVKNPFIQQASAAATNVVSSSVHHPILHSNSPTIQTPSFSSSSDIGLSLTMKDNITTANASSVNLSSANSPLAKWFDGNSNLKPVPNLSVQEGFSNSFSHSHFLPSPTPPISFAHQPRGPNLMQTQPSYHNASLHSYPPKAQNQSDLRSQLNQNNYNAVAERNDYAYAGERFESWNPQNNPTRDNRNSSRRNFTESRMNAERNYRPEWSRQRGIRKWHNQRR